MRVVIGFFLLKGLNPKEILPELRLCVWFCIVARKRGNSGKKQDKDWLGKVRDLESLGCLWNGEFVRTSERCKMHYRLFYQNSCSRSANKYLQQRAQKNAQRNSLASWQGSSSQIRLIRPIAPTLSHRTSSSSECWKNFSKEMQPAIEMSSFSDQRFFQWDRWRNFAKCIPKLDRETSLSD